LQFATTYTDEEDDMKLPGLECKQRHMPGSIVLFFQTPFWGSFFCLFVLDWNVDKWNWINEK